MVRFTPRPHRRSPRLDDVPDDRWAEEKPADDFGFGGWQALLIDEIVGQQIYAGMEGLGALLLGRRTHDIFASYWPQQAGRIAQLFNRIPNYVASRQSLNPEWAGTSQLGPDLACRPSEPEQILGHSCGRGRSPFKRSPTASHLGSKRAAASYALEASTLGGAAALECGDYSDRIGRLPIEAYWG
ncbi:hypothetical protein SAMN04487912_101242 [Arthrobacter sp. cf158]|uniref:hypothetical protein n=1 Tax=Arthrobacter sp. cf158 TaxID=1761744 RepID=UPI0008997C11|nr:hypothetical protein [Arthrobacter sp. cf158]SDW04412.1 hypothetical protein SAMN04487912_101242 [Arthrobacter sp. cf158]